MKAILGVLLCYVFFAAQCFAIKGGPDYGGTVSLIGQYAGVLTRVDPPEVSSGDQLNALGIFTLGVPRIGTASGQLIIFADGVYFFGAMQGIAQPNGKLSVLATADETATTTGRDSSGNVITITQVVSVLDGDIEATLGRNGSLGSAGALTGTARFNRHNPDGTDTDNEDLLHFTVSGFQQTPIPPS